LIDGKSIEEYDILELRKQIGYVMQEPVLFNMSIKDNILYGLPEASDAKVHQIAEMANALTFIESNFEELSPEEQLDVVHKEIRDLADKLKIQKLKELSKIPDLVALNIVRFVLENCDNIFKDWLEDHPDYFNTIVKDEVCD
jgi:ABC-type proline/glycine betaine transport system ATPase subunit